MNTNINEPSLLRQRVKLTSNPSNDFTSEILRVLAGSEKKLTEVQIRALMGCMGSYIGALVCIIFTAAVIYIASTDKKALTNRYYIYSAFIILPILVGSFMILPVFQSGAKPHTFMLIMFMVITSIVAIYYFMRNMNPKTVIWTNYLLFAFIAFSIVSILAVVYKVFMKYLKNVVGWPGFIIKILFFIPCLLIDLLQFLVNDYNNTPQIVGIIFIIQLIGIAGYGFLPQLYKQFTKYTNQSLVNQPIPLVRESKIANNDVFKLEEFSSKDSYIRFDPVNPDGNISNQYRQNFSVSMWVFINNSGISSYAYRRETPIFRYGNADMESNSLGKPLIVYYNDPNDAENQNNYKVYFSNSKKNATPTYTFSVPPQKWNNFVITYNEAKVDLFVNGDLVHSHTFETTKDEVTTAYPLFKKYDVMTVGYGNDDDDTKGVRGAICNVNYYKTPLSMADIATNYNLLKNKTPPLNYIV
jgi:hypothetical protein